MLFGFGEVCYVDKEVADMHYGYFLIVNILRMKLCCGYIILFTLF